MSETMIERLAQTLRDLTLANGGESRGAGDMLPDAQKLLQAMREPTENMAIAGGEAVPGDERAIHSEVAKMSGAP